MAPNHHHHHHIDANVDDRNIAVAVLINVSLTVVQIIGGLLSGSLAIIADAMHNLSDAIALVIAFGARRIARRSANADMTFGYARAEIVAALINYTTLIIIGLFLIYEAVMHFMEPNIVDGWIVIIVTGFALLVDVGTALLTYRMSKTSVNIRAAFLHNVADALGSVAVILGGTIILLYDWQLIDPLITLLIAGYILWQALSEIGPVIRILMLGAPPQLDAGQVLDSLRQIEGVENLHHAHLWQIDEHRSVLDAHVIIAQDQWQRADEIKQQVKNRLHQTFGINQSTIEMERADYACEDPEEFGT